MVARAATIVLWMAVLGAATPAVAADWGGLAPGTTTMEQVRGRYGGPTRSRTQKVEGYDAAQWVYDGAQAPAGITRMTIDFGLLLTGTYHPDVVRSFTLEPRRGVFTIGMITTGWGEPDRVSPTGQMPPSFFYQSGLYVTFDKDGRIAETMLFTLPQDAAPAAASPQR